MLKKNKNILIILKNASNKVQSSRICYWIVGYQEKFSSFIQVEFLLTDIK